MSIEKRLFGHPIPAAVFLPDSSAGSAFSDFHESRGPKTGTVSTAGGIRAGSRPARA